MITDKVIIMLVEGGTDEIALAPITAWIREKFDMRVQVTKGDIFTKYEYMDEPIEKTIERWINITIDRYKFELEDIAAVIQITDTDGTFIDDSKVIVDQSIEENKLYYEDVILVCNKTMQENIISRNNDKATKLIKMSSEESIEINDAQIPYFMFYFSCDLDHFIHDKRCLSKEEKVRLAREFNKKFRHDTVGFKAFFTENMFSVSGTFKETWSFIQQEENSLKRYSNFSCIFGILDEL